MKFNFMDGNDQIITAVSVNPLTKKVKIKNYTDDIMDRAFGVNENPTYQDVLDFFESRTFPRNRVSIDDILKSMGLKEYDPYKMCKKLQGRTEQDDFYIDFLED